MAVKDEFGELYRLEHTRHFTPERTALEVDTLVTALDLKPSERVLDLACGWGRHLTELKRRGFTNLVGADVQGAFPEPLAGVVMLEQDAAALDDNEFDAVYCAFNALFSTPDAASQVFASVAGALKPGGRFLFDTTNRERLAGAEYLARSWRESTPTRAGQVPLLRGGSLPWLLEETRFDPFTGAQEIFQRRIFASGHTRTQTLTRYHYTASELNRFLEAAGFSVTDVYGDWRLSPYTAQSPRLMLITRKEA